MENDVLLFDSMAGIRIPSAVIPCDRGMFREDEVEAILATFAGDDPRSLRERAGEVAAGVGDRGLHGRPELLACPVDDRLALHLHAEGKRRGLPLPRGHPAPGGDCEQPP